MSRKIVTICIRYWKYRDKKEKPLLTRNFSLSLIKKSDETCSVLGSRGEEITLSKHYQDDW